MTKKKTTPAPSRHPAQKILADMGITDLESMLKWLNKSGQTVGVSRVGTLLARWDKNTGDPVAEEMLKHYCWRYEAEANSVCRSADMAARMLEPDPMDFMPDDPAGINMDTLSDMTRLAQLKAQEVGQRRFNLFCELQGTSRDIVDRSLAEGRFTLSHIEVALMRYQEAQTMAEAPSLDKQEALIKLIYDTLGDIENAHETAVAFATNLQSQRKTVPFDKGAGQWLKQHWELLIPAAECDCYHTTIAAILLERWGIRITPETVGRWRRDVAAFTFGQK